jgi:hypothetical protein
VKKIIIYICAMAIAEISLGAVYKWTDEEGHVHYSDKPTEIYKTKKVDIEPGPSPEEIKRAREDAEALKQRSHEESSVDQLGKENRLAEREKQLAQEQLCLEARKQLAILQELQLPVYRDEKGQFRAKWQYDTYQGKREYLSDTMRTSETERVRENVVANCKHPDDAKEQEIARNQWIRSQYCAKYKAELETLEKPSARAAQQDLERNRRLVEINCK